ncbi:U-box domain-containing protein 21-like [Dorcoceras hygrometricum]|uniref:U-box domain-containing protein n=1 Tax=Dorcoceras hygrometricum TaxID=472368 RepID=A0A2Z7CHM2_9LAMI|nr:U-box domain-containing protein 21-like [Dorcoceras hygrometricum]
MISTWRRRVAARRAAKKKSIEEDDNANMELTIPNHFRCPISLDLMKDPVTLSTGITYDRESIEKWIEAGNVTCPITKKILRSIEPIPNHAIRQIIQDWCVENRSYGVERIPTPRVPISSHEVKEVLTKIEDAIRRNDDESCLDFVSMIKSLSKESDRNKRCVVSNGAGRVLSAAFDALSKRDPIHEHVALHEEILSMLMISLSSPLDEETRTNLSTSESLHYIVRFLRFGSLSSRRNAVLALKVILSCNDQEVVEDLVKREGLLDALMKLIEEPICPTTTKASLLAMYYILKSSQSNPDKQATISKFLEMGLVQNLLEILVDSERSVCEKALGVLDGICSHREGRNKVSENVLTVPLMVKKMLRVSDLATELSVSILWKLGKDEENGEGTVAIEALQVGAFQKLLLLLQVGCSGTTKEKVTDLLKILNVHRQSVECIDSLDFKNLKRPF